jgi:chromosome segregation ATPase
LKDKVADLVTKLEEALAKYYESDYRTQRAENLKEDYLEIIEKKIAENKAIFEFMDPLNKQIINLSEALTNAKKEIERLNNANNLFRAEIKDKNELILDANTKNEKLKRKNFELETENEKINQRLNEQNERIEIIQLSLDRQQSKTDVKDFNTPNSNNKANSKVKAGSINYNANNPQGSLAIYKDQSEEILKMQLQIVDLKKRLSEDEKIRINLFEVIKVKKAKNKSLKDEISKIVSIFEESGKENKWSHDLILQKDNIIKVLKEKINVLNNEMKMLNKKYVKFFNKNTEEKSVEANFPLEQFVRVKASPNLFLNKNNQKV